MPSMPRSSTGTTRASEVARSLSEESCARRELRGQGVRRAHRDGRRPGSSPVSAGGRRAAAHVGLREASRAVFELFKETSPLVEGLSIDEAFLDARGLGRISGTPEAIASRLRCIISV